MQDLKAPARYFEHPNDDLIEGLPAMGVYFDRSTNTILRWIYKHGLPAAKMPNGHWLISKRLIDQWILARHMAQIDRKKAEKEMETVDGFDIGDGLDIGEGTFVG